MSHEFENGCFPLGNLTEAVKARYPELTPLSVSEQWWLWWQLGGKYFPWKYVEETAATPVKFREFL